jgi:tetratricopeptide (TPR) repeat protein
MHWKQPCILYTTLLLLILQTTFGQTPDADSLKKVYRNLKMHDSLRIDAASRFAYRIFNSDTNLSNQWYDSAVLIAKTKEKQHLSMIALGSKALARVNKGQYDEALKIWSVMYDQAKKIDYKVGMGNALYGKGLTYYYLQQYDTSIQIQQKTLEIFKDINRPDKALNCFNNMASSYLMQGNYPFALDYFKKANAIAVEMKDSAYMVITYGNCGMVYKYMEKYKEAMEYYRSSYQLALQTGDNFQVAAQLQKMGTILDSQDSSSAAIELYKQALTLNITGNYERAAGENLSNIGIAYSELGIYDSAWVYLNQSLPVLEKYGDLRATGIIKSNLAKIFFSASPSFLKSIGFTQLSALSQSKQLHKDALKIFQEIETPYNEASTWEALANIYNREGNYKLAFEAMQNLRLLRDSIFKDETKEKILETELKYEQEKREALLLAEHEAELNERKFIQKITITGAIIALLATAGFYTLNRKRLAAKAAGKEAELAAEKLELENKALRSQMNPHFIFNALNSIADYVRKNEANIAEEYLAKFARLMRLVLENSEHKEVPLSSDLEALNLYIQLEALRAGKLIEYSVVVSPDIDAENTLVPPLLLQPFVENSIWHGIVPKNGNGKLNINIALYHNLLEFSVEDNGVGLSKAGIQQHSIKGSSMGMKLTERRIQLFNNTSPISQHGVTVEELQEGIRIVFQIPYKPTF